jgi:hypothetical protein
MKNLMIFVAIIIVSLFFSCNSSITEENNNLKKEVAELYAKNLNLEKLMAKKLEFLCDTMSVGDKLKLFAFEEFKDLAYAKKEKESDLAYAKKEKEEMKAYQEKEAISLKYWDVYREKTQLAFKKLKKDDMPNLQRYALLKFESDLISYDEKTYNAIKALENIPTIREFEGVDNVAYAEKKAQNENLEAKYQVKLAEIKADYETLLQKIEADYQKKLAEKKAELGIN